MAAIEAFKNRREPEAVHMLADAFWHMLLILSLLGAIAIIGFNLWEFSDVGRALSTQSTSVAAGKDTLPFEKKDLQTVVNGFVNRKATYQLYSTQVPVVVDPSETKIVKPTKPTR